MDRTPNRVTVNCTQEMLAQVAHLVERHHPYLSRHRLARIALREGLHRLAQADRATLEAALREDHHEARST